MVVLFLHPFLCLRLFINDTTYLLSLMPQIFAKVTISWTFELKTYTTRINATMHLL
jgi:hypothetical protein